MCVFTGVWATLGTSDSTVIFFNLIISERFCCADASRSPTRCIHPSGQESGHAGREWTERHGTGTSQEADEGFTQQVGGG